jgi:thioredoxin 1
MALAVNDDNFEAEVINSDTPVLVDFWAEWCGPCKALAPVLDELSSEMGDKIKVVKVNIEEAPETPTKFGIRGVPTLILFKGGEVSDTRVGGMPKEQLKAWVEGQL